LGFAQILRRLALCAPVLIVALCITLPAYGAGEKEERALDLLNTRLQEVTKALARPDLNDERLQTYREDLEKIRTETLITTNELAPKVTDANTRLDQLGDAPEKTGEPADLTAKRKQLTEEASKLLSLQKRFELVAVTASQLASRAANTQRKNFYDKVFETSLSVFNLKLWSNGRSGVHSFFSSSYRIIASWISDIFTAGGALAILGLVALFTLGLMASLVIRRVLSKIVGPNIAETEPATLSRLWRVVRGLLINEAAFVVAVLGVALVLKFFLILPEKVEVLGFAFLRAGMFFIAVYSITRGVLATSRREWRLASLTDTQAARLKRVIDLGGFIIATSILLKEMSAVVFAPVSAAILVSAIIAILLVGCLFRALAVVKQGQAGDGEVQETKTPMRRGGFRWLAQVRLALWVFGVICLIAVAIGYISLGQFIMTQLAYTGTMVAILYLLHHLIDETVISGLQPGWAAGDFLRSSLGLADRGVERLGLVLGTFTDFLLFFIGVPLIIGQWALTWVDFHSWITTAFFGFNVGGVNISLANILSAVLALIIGLLLTRVVTAWLDNRVLSRAHINRGVRDSIRTATGYLGFLLAVIMSLTFAGVNFSNIALIAGALGVGIGFGLQSIVNNFVSGLILLAERPIKVGDWINVTGGEGYVKRINVRSTEIETFDKCAIIVPNSNLISEPVQNWTHGDTMGRVRVPIGVSYDTDPESLRDVIYACATGHDQVLAFPQPTVVFMGFGASSLDFELRCFIPEVDYVLAVSSDLRFAIFKAFKENNIEIPFPQTDLHIKDIGELKTVLAGPGKPAARNKGKSS
jgi:potassium efflux system protein